MCQLKTIEANPKIIKHFWLCEHPDASRLGSPKPPPLRRACIIDKSQWLTSTLGWISEALRILCDLLLIRIFS